MPHLWEIETPWFNKNQNEYIHSTFPYKSWKDFLDCKPYKLWKPYILSSWSWQTRPLSDITEPKRRDTDKGPLESHKIMLLNQSSYVKDSVRAKEDEIEMLQIVFLSPERFTGVHRAEIVVKKEDEASVRDWLQRHMPSFWKLE
jgi:hypothetical protein